MLNLLCGTKPKLNQNETFPLESKGQICVITHITQYLLSVNDCPKSGHFEM